MGIDVNINGLYKSMSDGWTNIGGIWKKINSVYTNIGGAWKESFTSKFKGFATVYTYGIETSKDGIDWNYTALSTEYLGINAITYGNGTWVARGNNHLIYSTDGMNWTLVTSIYASIRDIKYANGIFLGVGVGGSVITSVDGITWVDRDAPNYNYYCVAFGKTGIGEDAWIAAGSNGAISVSTDNGSTWTAKTSLGFTANCMTYGNGVFVIGGENYIGYTSSINTVQKVSKTGITYYHIAFGNGKFIATVGSGTSLHISTNGSTWTTKSVSGILNSYQGVAFGNGLFMLRTSKNTAISTDSGVTWIVYDYVGSQPSFNALSYGGD